MTRARLTEALAGPNGRDIFAARPILHLVTPAPVIAEVAKVLESFGPPHTGAGTGPTHIFNLGHGISQYTPPEHVNALVDAVHAHSRRLRRAA